MAYFIRRAGNDCAVIALHPDDREEIIAEGLAIGAAEDLCASKIEALRSAKPTPLLDERAAQPLPARAAAGVQVLGRLAFDLDAVPQELSSCEMAARFF
jgi:hypothetical protein